jgi:hypothetical protein
LSAAPPADANASSAIRTLASQVAGVLDDTTRQLGGSPPLGASADAVEAVTASANALIDAIGRFAPDDWRAPRHGTTPAIDLLRRGIAEAGALVRRATTLTEAAD